MDDVITSYLQKRRSVERARAEVTELVDRLYQASEAFSGPRNMAGRSPAWKNILVPNIPPLSMQRARSAVKAFDEEWPNKEQMFEKIRLYWVAIADMDVAYNLIPYDLRDGISTPIDWPTPR